MLVVLQLFALFMLVGLGFYVFVADPRKRAHQTFAAFIAFLAIWTTKDIVFWNFYPRDSTAGWWASASFIIALLMQYALAVFAWVFPENSRTPRPKAAILFAPGVVFIPAAVFGLLWSKAGFEDGRFVIDLTPVAYAFVAYVYFVFCFGAWLLVGKYRRYRGTIQGKQVAAIIAGLIITGALKTLVNIALPFFGNYELLPYSAIVVLPGVLIYAYAILSFRLFSLQTALNQFRLFPITYKVAISIAAVAVVSFCLFQIPITWWSFHSGMDEEAWRRYLVMSVITALVPNLLLLLLVLRTISRPLQRITVAAIQVTNGAYGTEVDLKKSNDDIGVLAASFNEMSRKMALDIEELRRLNEHLIRAEKLAAMGTLAAGVAHEVNNPLASISSLVQMLRAQEGHNVETRETLQLISTQIDRIKQVTSDMTNFARSRPAARTETDMNAVIRSALRLAKFDKSFHDLDVKLQLSPGLLSALVDDDQLQQVFLNLFLNARDAMDGAGELVIASQEADSEIKITIADTGPGIRGDQKHLVFDPFYTTKSAGSGTGLGLAVCYAILTAHGGTIEVSDNTPTGAVFEIRIPAASTSTSPRPVAVDA